MVSSSVANILSILIPWPLSQTLIAKLNSGGREWWEIHQKRSLWVLLEKSLKFFVVISP